MEPAEPLNTAAKTPPENPRIEGAPPPRAFAQGTGVLLQTVGIILFLSSCCICGTSFLWEQRQSTLEVLESARVNGLQVSTLADPAKLGLMLTVMFSSVGGLAMAACGLGLQSEHRRAAWGAMGTVVALTLILIGAGVGLWVGDASVAARLWNLVIILIMLLLCGFTWAALREVIAAPPPPDIDIVSPGTKIPYSFYHDDPPEVRLAKELAGRRARLDVEREEIERMEKALEEKKSEK